jgi:hypothetical protein
MRADALSCSTSPGRLFPGGFLSRAALAVARRFRREPPSGRYRLRRDATASFRPGTGGVEILGQRGLLLVTQAGDPRDHILGPGGRFGSSGRGRIAIWALSEAAFAVIPRAAG